METVRGHISRCWCFENLIFFENSKYPFDTVSLYMTYSKYPLTLFSCILLIANLPLTLFSCILLIQNIPLTVHCFPLYYLFKVSLWHCFPVYYSFKVSLWHCFPVYYSFTISLWHGFRVPPTTPWSMCLPAALRRPQKRHVPGFLEHAFCECCGFCYFWEILRSPGKIFIIWPICSNDYASKTRIKILCKKPVPMPQDVFS